MHPVTLRVTLAQDSIRASTAERRASPAAFPRGAWERSGRASVEESGRPVGRLALALALHAPSRGRAQVLRSGHRGKDAAVAAPGHGWPMAAGPRSRTGARACRALARHRTSGARALWLLWGFSKVTRRQGGTLSRRYRKNGYVPNPNPNPNTVSSIRRIRPSLLLVQATNLSLHPTRRSIKGLTDSRHTTRQWHESRPGRAIDP
jgi:hypothetical protein